MKVIRGERELSEKDVEEISKGFIPGEWICLIDQVNQKKYIAFAAGSGITPILSIIKTTLAVEAKSSFTLIFGPILPRRRWRVKNPLKGGTKSER